MNEVAGTSGRCLSLETTAERLEVSTKTVRRMIADGDLPAYRVGKRLLRIRESDLDRLLRRVPTVAGGTAA